MNRHENKQHWENIYTLKRPEDLSWFQNEAKISLKLIQSISDKNAWVLDIGAGASILVDSLLKYGYSKLAVLDVSGRALDLVKARLKEQAMKVEWHEADIREFRPRQSYDIWHDRAVFHFLTDEESRKSYVVALKRAVEGGGHVIIATFAKNGPKKCSGLDIIQYDNESLESELGYEFKLLKSEAEIHITPGLAKQHFNYFIFQRQ